ncbi:galactokinase [Frigoribacterium faeni]|uniref:Galactokinase n=1 Tax=Frigoribacterium faeni TaxID=145483 RepID=A0A7W3JJD9_9MICO|nr:galactokinase [Frigoribacterium faeni]MBA8813938.1 galactokinase [Frigoribacterium faeni]GEK82087.1 galactokinase [Frigoribacterium faeni]
MTDTTTPRGFADVFDTEVVGRWSAPGRVNLIGEHTDYNDGFVLPFAIDRRTTVTVGRRDDRLLRISSTFEEGVHEISLDALDPASMSGWSTYAFGIAWALSVAAQHSDSPAFAAAGGDLTTIDLSTARGLDLFVDSEVPVGAGLSSSAALECAVAVAFAELWSIDVNRSTLAAVGQLAENDAVGAPTGIMDQSASLLGQADSGVFLDCRSLDADVVDLGFAAAGLEVLVIDTNVEHAHATGGYVERRSSCEKGAAALGVTSLRDLDAGDLERAEETLDDETFRRVRHVITENQRVLDTVRTLRTEGPLAIGRLLDASHVSMRDDFEISVPELDLAVATAQATGALGARMTGGGFGGSAIALVPAEARAAVEAAVVAAFADAAYTAPTLFTVNAAEGARRDG